MANTLMGRSSKKTRNLLALLLAAGTCQASILVALLLTSSAVVGSFAPPASAQAGGVAIVISRVFIAAANVVKGIFGIKGNDDAKREAFTQQFVEEANKQYPNYNVVISHNGGSVEGNNIIHDHLELPMTVGTCGYEAYMSPKGQHFKFVRNGDGGFINWAYGGDFNREDNTITAN